jgi:hypothetical protein
LVENLIREKDKWKLNSFFANSPAGDRKKQLLKGYLIFFFEEIKFSSS